MIDELKQLDNLNSGKELEINVDKKKSKVPIVHDISINEDTGSITIDSVNIDNFQIKYYLIDAEMLFSSSPFVEEQIDNFSYVVPFTTATLQTNQQSNICVAQLP